MTEPARPDRRSDAPGWSPRTLAVAVGRPDADGQPLNVPIVLASNLRGSADYTRTNGTAGWEAFEAAVGALEGGRAVSFASGMGAASAALHAFLPRVLVLPKVSYLGVRSLVGQLVEGGRMSVRMVDVTDTDAVLAAADGADLVWLESPTNPTLDVADLTVLCSTLRDRGVPTVVDSTFATPLGQRPLDLGATVVLHSATKFIGGHSDLLMGVLITGDDDVHERIISARSFVGATPGALESFLALRGLRTLALRFEAASASATVLAERLRAHSAVADVRRIGPMMAVVMSGGAPVADGVCSRVRLCVPATSLGGVETTLERRQKLAGDAHVHPGLLRVSVGIEDVEDLWTDLRSAIDASVA